MTENDNNSIEYTPFEPEDEGEEAEIAPKPYDARKVNVTTNPQNLGSILYRLENNEIDLFPAFQREGELWNSEKESRLIESILINLPIPAFYFNQTDDDIWEVVDGLQRLTTIKKFVYGDSFSLKNLEFLTELNGKNYKDIGRSLQRRIFEYPVTTFIIRPGTPEEVKYSLFKRINTGGISLTNQEIRHAVSQGKKDGRASEVLTNLASSTAFKTVIGGKNKRMAHQELVLRYIAFKIQGSDEYKSSLPKFLDSAMTKLTEMEDERLEKIQSHFKKVLNLANFLFGDHSFRKSILGKENIRTVNKPLFECLTVGLSNLTNDDKNIIMEHKNQFEVSLKKLLSEYVFNESISKSTANTDNVKYRFKKIKELINNFLKEIDVKKT